MASLFKMKIERAVDDYLASDTFKDWFRLRARWMIQGFEEGYQLADREAFTATIAKRIRQKGRDPVYLFGYRIWRKRPTWDFCNREAERIVTEFLRTERIKFGDPQFHWKDGIDLADEDMSYWESCP